MLKRTVKEQKLGCWYENGPRGEAKPNISEKSSLSRASRLIELVSANSHWRFRYAARASHISWMETLSRCKRKRKPCSMLKTSFRVPKLMTLFRTFLRLRSWYYSISTQLDPYPRNLCHHICVSIMRVWLSITSFWPFMLWTNDITRSEVRLMANACYRKMCTHRNISTRLNRKKLNVQI